MAQLRWHAESGQPKCPTGLGRVNVATNTVEIPTYLVGLLGWGAAAVCVAMGIGREEGGQVAQLRQHKMCSRNRCPTH